MEFKFRAFEKWDIEMGTPMKFKWVYDEPHGVIGIKWTSGIDDDYDYFYSLETVMFDDSWIKQFWTGMLDHFKIEIYEGDIIQIRLFDSDNVYQDSDIYLVKWSDEKHGFVFQDESGCEWHVTNDNHITVIGNIFQNPNLFVNKGIQPTQKML
jgi:uncharacterized phage protein (TIGR01671 family)